MLFKGADKRHGLEYIEVPGGGRLGGLRRAGRRLRRRVDQCKRHGAQRREIIPPLLQHGQPGKTPQLFDLPDLFQKVSPAGLLEDPRIEGKCRFEGGQELEGLLDGPLGDDLTRGDGQRDVELLHPEQVARLAGQDHLHVRVLGGLRVPVEPGDGPPGVDVQVGIGIGEAELYQDPGLADALDYLRIGEDLVPEDGEDTDHLLSVGKWFHRITPNERCSVR